MVVDRQAIALSVANNARNREFGGVYLDLVGIIYGVTDEDGEVLFEDSTLNDADTDSIVSWVEEYLYEHSCFGEQAWVRIVTPLEAYAHEARY